MQTVLAEGLVFPEGPRWHMDQLWVADQHAHQILTFDMKGRKKLVAEFDDKPSGLGFLPDGTPLATLMRKRQIVRFGNGRVSVYADLNSLPGHNLNDMVIDGNGRAYVGNRTKVKRDASGAPVRVERSDETVVLVEPDGRFRAVADDMRGPNGAAITPDGKTLIVAESFGNRLSAFTIEKDGSLTNRRVFAELGAVPDGICLDAEGAVWVGLVFNSEFVRVRDGGEILQRIPLAGNKWAIACILGGPSRRSLFMLTAFQSHENLARMVDFQADLTSTSKGFVETMEVSVAGAGWP